MSSSTRGLGLAVSLCLLACAAPAERDDAGDASAGGDAASATDTAHEASALLDATGPLLDALVATDGPSASRDEGAALDATGPAPDGPAPALDAAVAMPDARTRDVGATDSSPATPDAMPPSGARLVTTTPPPGDPAMRTQAEVCALWNDASARAATAGPFTPGAAMCAPGTLAASARDAAVLMTNVYRWLAGLPNVGENASHSSAAQACAELMQANGRLSHTPPTTWTCYTALGAMGAGKSNIAAGTRTPVAAVAGWVDDQRDATMTLGHRRWILYPRLGNIGYGQAQSYACQYVLGAFVTGAKSFVAWPNEGVTPIEASTPLWSFSSAGLGVTASTRAAVTANGAPVAVTSALRANGYGDPTISWMMPALVAGTTYEVTITGLRDNAMVRYTVRPVRCGG